MDDEAEVVGARDPRRAEHHEPEEPDEDRHKWPYMHAIGITEILRDELKQSEVAARVSRAFGPFPERALEGLDRVLEVFVDTPLDVAESRDPKGLYVKARRGELKNFTGVDSPYEVPAQPELRLDTTRLTAEDSAQEILRYLERMGILA